MLSLGSGNHVWTRLVEASSLREAAILSCATGNDLILTKEGVRILIDHITQHIRDCPCCGPITRKIRFGRECGRGIGLEEQMIEKYGVVTEQIPKCPLCGEELDTSTTPPVCPTHGTVGIEKESEELKGSDPHPRRKEKR